MGDKALQGGCYCGKVRIEYTGEPAMTVPASGSPSTSISLQPVHVPTNNLPLRDRRSATAATAAKSRGRRTAPTSRSPKAK